MEFKKSNFISQNVLENIDRFLAHAKKVRDGEKLRFVVTNAKKEHLEEMFAKEPGGGKILDSLPLIGGYVVEVNPKVLKDIFKSIPKNANFTLDEKKNWIPELGGHGNSKNAGGRIGPKLDIAGTTLGLEKVWARKLTGKGITMAVIDTGIDPHDDLNNIIDFKDMVNGQDGQPYDDHGHGTHCAGDAAGSGKASGGKYKGPAHDAKLVGIKVLDKGGSGTNAGVISGIQYAVGKKRAFDEGKPDGINIRVISMSLGSPAASSWKDDPVCLAVEKAVEAGIVCVVAAGNSGPRVSTIGSPGIAPSAITVGAMDDKDTPVRKDDDIARFSSIGPTIDKLIKPDIISPGVNIWAPNVPDSTLDKRNLPKTPDGKYLCISGTSMATPIVAGIVAILLQANPNLTPLDVAKIISESGVKLESHPDYDGNVIGRGMIDPVKAVNLAYGWLEGEEMAS